MESEEAIPESGRIDQNLVYSLQKMLPERLGEVFVSTPVHDSVVIFNKTVIVNPNDWPTTVFDESFIDLLRLKSVANNPLPFDLITFSDFKPKPCSYLPMDVKPFTRTLLSIDEDNITLTGKKVRLAIIDQGLDKDVLTLKKKFNSEKFTFENDTMCHIHGTVVATIASGLKFNGFCIDRTICMKYPQGVAPKADVSLYSLCKDNTIRQLLQKILKAEPKFDVISISMIEANRNLDGVIKKISDEGTIIFAGSGNGGDREPILYPACLPDVVSVGALRPKGQISDCSRDQPPYSDVYVYGEVLVPSLKDLGGDVMPFFPELFLATGTSMATPAAAGLACLAIQYAIEQGFTDRKARRQKLLHLFQPEGRKEKWIHKIMNCKEFMEKVEKEFKEVIVSMCAYVFTMCMHMHIKGLSD